MKKLFLILLGCFSLFFVTSCDKTISMENTIPLTLTEEWKNTITTNGQIPCILFEYDGSFNVYETSSELGYIFTKNDNTLLSDAIQKHFDDKIKGNYIVTSKTLQEYDTEGGALFGDKRIQLDAGTNSYEYTIVAWDETGTRYSMMYRSFIANGKVYYAYTYHSGITMSLEVPLIVQEVNGTQQVFMTCLPYDTVYKLNVSTKIKSLLNKEEYLEEEYHVFNYPNYLKDSTNKELDIQNWYVKYCDGRTENDQFIFTYIGIDYVLKCFDNTFTIYVK